MVDFALHDLGAHWKNDTPLQSHDDSPIQTTPKLRGARQLGGSFRWWATSEPPEPAQSF
jgi:hypothetical protein